MRDKDFVAVILDIMQPTVEEGIELDAIYQRAAQRELKARMELRR